MKNNQTVEISTKSASVWVEEGDDLDMASIAVWWEKNHHPVGIVIRYSENVSHKTAFFKMVEGMWKAMQDPDAYNVGVDENNGNPEPYAILTEEVE